MIKYLCYIFFVLIMGNTFATSFPIKKKQLDKIRFKKSLSLSGNYKGRTNIEIMGKDSKLKENKRKNSVIPVLNEKNQVLIIAD